MGRFKKETRPQNTPNSTESPSSFKFGRFTALNVSLEEASANNRVLRIPLITYSKKKSQSSRPAIERFAKNMHPVVKLVECSVKPNLLNSSPVKSLSLKSLKSAIRTKMGVNTLAQSCFCSRLTADFTKISQLVCVMKLPSPTWKVSVIMDHDLSTELRFANNIPPKCVTFSQTNPDCNIMMDGVPVILLGCPRAVENLQDIEILLEIVDRLDLRDCMVWKV